MAARFWIGGGTTTGWDASPTTNWAATSGGAVRVAAPTATDDVTFDGAGANGNTVSVLSANNSCLSLTFTTGYTSTITINTGIVLTVAGNFTDRTNHSWTVSGTGSMTISATSTITSNGKTFPGPVSFSGSNTKTLVGDWTITGTLTCSTTTTTINKTTAEVLSCGGFSAPVAATAGTINITVTGGTIGTISSAIAFSGTFSLAGNITFTAATIFIFSTGTLKYVSGTITLTTHTLRCTAAAGATLDTAGVSWINVEFSQTQTINSLLTATLITFTGTTTLAGTAGFTTATLTTSSGSTVTFTLANGVTYTVTAAFTFRTSSASLVQTFTSDHATNKAILTISPNATTNCAASFTRIDASRGRSIPAFNGTVTTCFNIFSYTDVPEYPYPLSRLSRRKDLYNRTKNVRYSL